MRLFGDDCLVYGEFKSHQVQVTIQSDLHALQLWAECWGMRLNPQKCYIMHVTRQAHRVQMYELCGVTLDCVTQAKYPGVIISADLQWPSQVCAVVKKANTTLLLHFISRTLKYSSPPLLRPPCLPRNCVHIREVAFGEGQVYMHSK